MKANVTRNNYHYPRSKVTRHEHYLRWKVMRGNTILLGQRPRKISTIILGQFRWYSEKLHAVVVFKNIFVIDNTTKPIWIMIDFKCTSIVYPWGQQTPPPHDPPPWHLYLGKLKKNQILLRALSKRFHHSVQMIGT